MNAGNFRNITPIKVPTEFSTVGYLAANSPDLTDVCGCENSRISRDVMKVAQRLARNPRVFMDHWDSQDKSLREELAGLHDVSPDQVFLSAAALGGIQHAFEVLVGRETQVGLLKPDFPAFEHYVSKSHTEKPPRWLENKTFPFTFSVDQIADFINRDAINFLIFSNPNPATGTRHNIAAIEKLVAATSATIVCDEADALDTNSSADLTNRHDNLVVVRSFSKFYALAGVRVGYLVCSQSLTSRFRDAVNPVALGLMAIPLAQAALADVSFQKKTQDNVKRNHAKLQSALSKTPWQLVPDSECFAALLWGPEGTPDPWTTLLEHSIKSLDGERYFGIPHSVRINLSDRQKIDRLAMTLEDIFPRQIAKAETARRRRAGLSDRSP